MKPSLDSHRNLLQVYYNMVVRYAEDVLGYMVIEGPNHVDRCMPDVKIIKIYSLNGVESRLFALLHECGHALIRRNHDSFKAKYPAHAEHDGDRRKESAAFRLSTLEEEIDAWKRGWNLAKRLGLSIDRGAWDKQRTKFLMTYVVWAAG